MNIRNYLRNPYRVFMLLGDRGFLNWLPDEPFLKLIYRANTGRKLHLNPPVTYCDKTNWLKIHDRQARYTQMADKVGVREYAAAVIGPEYLVPLLGVWDRAEDIDFDALPARFVLKATHDSGSAVVCRDKAVFDRAAAVKQLSRALKNQYWKKGREHQYEHVVPRIIAEEFLDPGENMLPTDYKIFCFGGEAKCLYTGTDRGTAAGLKQTFFDFEWNRLPIRCEGYLDGSYCDVPPPAQLPLMKTLAEKLSAGIPLMRVDFYESVGRVYFGEMTLCDGSGFSPLDPPEWERRFGDWITLPEAHAPEKNG